MKYKIMTAAAVVFSAGLLAGILAVCWFEYGSPLIISLTGVGACLFLPICSFLHELGHALFGLFSKMRAEVNISSAFTCFSPSFCRIVPHTDRGVRGRFLATACGGLAVNLLLIAFGLCALAIPEIPTFLAAVLPASFYIFAVNIAPAAGNNKTDGEVICGLIRFDDSARVAVNVLTIQSKILAGTPISDIDEKLFFDLPQLPEDDIEFIILTDLRRRYFEARGDAALAAKYAERFESLKEYLPDCYTEKP